MRGDRLKMEMLIAIAAVLMLSLAAGAQAGITEQKLDRKVTVSYKAGYLLYTPEAMSKKGDTKFPLILFLHGAGERGSDLDKLRVHGPWSYAAANPDFPFMVASPQCPEQDWWDRITETLAALVDELVEKYPVDTQRIYVTGLSMGGFGTWALACDYPDRFAAVAPICGGGSTFLACRMKDVPVWAFHGAKDNIVPVSRTVEMIAALTKCEAKEVKATIYPEAQHDSWTETYNNPEFYNWLLSHKLSGKPQLDK